MTGKDQRIFVIYVEDKPGVLNRVSSLFRRRAYNIDSLNVSKTQEAGVSRMTVVLQADSDQAKRIEANLYKLVNVLRVDDITDAPSVTRDLALIKVKAGAKDRAEILQIASVFRARVVDVSNASIMLEITGAQDKIEGLVEVLEPFGILEMAQTGSVAMTRGKKGKDQEKSVKLAHSIRAVS